MIGDRIPFEDIGIPPDVGKHTANVIQRLLSERPDTSIDIQKVSEETGYLGAVVKQVFYALLAFRKLKATFLPRHQVCGNIIGNQEQSVETIKYKARKGDYACFHCFEPIEGPENIEIQIVFWKLGTNVNT